MNTQKTPARGRVTPLWIVASFLTLTEATLCYAVTQVSGGVQIALTAFVIAFALIVACGFFAILWKKPWVFYAPSEYGNIDPRHFRSALHDSPAVGSQIELVKKVEENPRDESAKFTLIDSLADEVECQLVILMHELKKDVPRYSPYAYENAGGSGQGTFSPFGRGNRLEGSGLVSVGGNGNYWALTDEGHRFAEWLLSKGRKHSFFWTPYGGWGSPKPGSIAEKLLAEKKAEE